MQKQSDVAFNIILFKKRWKHRVWWRIYTVSGCAEENIIMNLKDEIQTNKKINSHYIKKRVYDLS